MKKSLILFVLLLGAFFLALSQVPDVINIQGKLETQDGEPVDDGEHEFIFTIYTSVTSTVGVVGFLTTVTTNNGLFSTNIGPFSGSAAFDRQYWVGITVDEDPELSERIMLTTVPYAYSSKNITDPIGSDKIKISAVTEGKIADGAVTQSKLANGITAIPTGEAGGDLTGTFPGPFIKVNAIDSDKLADGAVTEDKIEDGAVSQSKLAEGVTAPPSGTAGGDLTGYYPSPTIAAGAIGSDEIEDGAVSSSKIQDLSIDTYHIIDESITQDKIAAEVSFQPTGNAGGDLAGTYPDPTIALQAVTTEKIGVEAVQTNNIADNAVETEKIKDLAVTTAKIDNWAVTSNKIIDETVVRDLNGCQDNVELIEGANISISVNTLLDEITISSTCCEEDLFPINITIDDPEPPLRIENTGGPGIRVDQTTGRDIIIGANGSDDNIGDDNDIVIGDGITIRGTNGTVSLGRSGSNPNNVYAPAGMAWAGRSDGENEDDHGIAGRANRGHGVHGESTDGQGVHGESINNNGVCGESTHGHGVSGTSGATGHGVSGTAEGTGCGVSGHSSGGHGLCGSTDDDDHSGVHGSHGSCGTSFHGANCDPDGDYPVSGGRGHSCDDSGGWGLHGRDDHQGGVDCGGVLGESTHGTGVRGICDDGPGIHGTSVNDDGGWGETTHGHGLRGDSENGHGVHGESDNGSGLWGSSTHGDGVHGESANGHGVCGLGSAPERCGVHGEHLGSGTRFHGANWGDPDDPDCPPSGLRGSCSSEIGGWGLHGVDRNEDLSLTSGGILAESIHGTGISSHSEFGRAGKFQVDSFFDVLYAVNNGCGTEAHLGNCDNDDVPLSGVFGNNSSESGGYGVAGVDRCLSEASTNAGLFGESQHNSGYGLIAENSGMGWAGLFNSSHPDGSPTQCYLGGSDGVAAIFYGGVDIRDNDAGDEGLLKVAGSSTFDGSGVANSDWTFNSTVQFNDDPTFGTEFDNVEVNVSGNVTIDGTLIASLKYFRIDHPLDPEKKWLYHSCVESSERLNTYSGNVILDENGEATVEFPDWFEAINTDFRYQLTAIGGASPTLHIAQKVKDNKFKIGGGCPYLEVSWQITCVRNDKFARENPFKVERNK